MMIMAVVLLLMIIILVFTDDRGGRCLPPSRRMWDDGPIGPAPLDTDDDRTRHRKELHGW